MIEANNTQLEEARQTDLFFCHVINHDVMSEKAPFKASTHVLPIRSDLDSALLTQNHPQHPA
jgi:hypothetical protein